jgi:alkyl sulfatase BDS1-like metallo-beta-lactamase superfamily hydrolase
LNCSSPIGTADLATLKKKPLKAHVQGFVVITVASLNLVKATDPNLKINFVFSDLNESYAPWIENAVLHFRNGPSARDAKATLTMTKPFFLTLIASGPRPELSCSTPPPREGSTIDLGRFFSMIEKTPGTFPVVTR